LRLKEKLHANATDHLETGEEVHESVRVRHGTLRQQNHALIATDRNLYAFRLTWPGFTNVAELLLKIPITRAEVDVTGWRVEVRDRETREGRKWKRLRALNPQPLAEYVNGRSSDSSHARARS
jgi:hypothetical protein